MKENESEIKANGTHPKNRWDNYHKKIWITQQTHYNSWRVRLNEIEGGRGGINKAANVSRRNILRKCKFVYSPRKWARTLDETTKRFQLDRSLKSLSFYAAEIHNTPHKIISTYYGIRKNFTQSLKQIAFTSMRRNNDFTGFTLYLIASKSKKKKAKIIDSVHK